MTASAYLARHPSGTALAVVLATLLLLGAKHKVPGDLDGWTLASAMMAGVLGGLVSTALTTARNWKRKLIPEQVAGFPLTTTRMFVAAASGLLNWSA